MQVGVLSYLMLLWRRAQPGHMHMFIALSVTIRLSQGQAMQLLTWSVCFVEGRLPPLARALEFGKEGVCDEGFNAYVGAAEGVKAREAVVSESARRRLG